jgi:tRNA (mo5U34)-methyltransferase
MSFRRSPFTSGLAESCAIQVHALQRGLPYHSLEFNGEMVPGLIPVEALQRRLDLLGVPADLHGRTVLDVGAASGWNSFEMERRGAKVTALDCVPYEEFHLFQRRIGSNTRYLIADFDRVSVRELGSFDIILFLGVLYHLRHPLLALETLCAMCDGEAYIESYICDSHHDSGERDGEAAMCEFYEADQLGGQIDNWWGPSRRALMALCRAAGFSSVELRYIDDRRAGVVCSRRPHRPSVIEEEAPFLSGAVGNRSGRPVCTAGNDEYLSLYFDSSAPNLSAADVHIRLGEFGIPLLSLHASGDSKFQATARLPAWAQAGNHTISVCTSRSPWSNPAVLQLAPYAGPLGQPPDLYARPLQEPEVREWPESAIIHSATILSRKTALNNQRVFDLNVFLQVDGAARDCPESIVVSIDGCWYAAFWVTVTPLGLVQGQLLRILDDKTTDQVSLSVAFPERQIRSKEIAVRLTE